jgi:hypothetical protein
MLDVSFKFLIILRVCLRLIESTNVTLELRYWHNNPKSLESLIESLESYLELQIIFYINIILVLQLILSF